MTLHTLTSVYKFSILFSILFLWYFQREFAIMIIFFTLMTLMFDSGVILFGEIRSLSPLGINEMSKTCLRMTHMFQKEAV